jgi:hypothetical protein
MLCGIGIAFFLYFFQIFYKTDCFLAGVRVAGISIAGYTKGERRKYYPDHCDKAAMHRSVFITKSLAKYPIADLCGMIDVKQLIEDIDDKKKKKRMSKISNMDGRKKDKLSRKGPLQSEYAGKACRGMGPNTGRSSC